ncbi:hypothetical protein [Streptomyces lavendulae]|uniref:hypothetical protein n=1 Tax=Streptomyces lavendulae TaxID=1914 RepID=UPI00382C18FF
MADSAVTDLPFTFSVPQEFTTFDLSQSPEERADAAIARLNSMDPALAGDKIARVVLTQQTAAGLLAAGGVVYAGTLVAASRQSPKVPVSAFLSVTVRPGNLSDETEVQRLTRDLASSNLDAEVGVVVLPVGQAVLFTEDTTIETAVNLVESGGGSTVRQLHVLVPLPGRTAVADFSIATESIPDWDDVVSILASVCQTITFS